MKAPRHHPSLQTLCDRDLVAASETLSKMAFTARAVDGLSAPTRASFESWHWAEIVLLATANGIALSVMTNESLVHGELSRRAQRVLARYRAASAGPRPA